MNKMIDILDTAHSKLSNLDIKTRLDLLHMMCILSLLYKKRLLRRLRNHHSTDILEWLVDIQIGDSKSEIKKLIKNNGVKINNKPIPDNINKIEWLRIDDHHLTEFVVVKKGKNHFDIIFNRIDLIFLLYLIE